MVRIPGASKNFGNFEESPEETRKWAKLVKAFEQNGGVGTQLEFEVAWTDFKHPYELKRWNPATKKREVTDPNGCQFTFEVVTPGIDGLRFWDDGAYSDHINARLVKILNAAAGRKIGEDEEVDPAEFVTKKPHLLLTIEMGKATERQDRGAHFFNVRGYRAIPKAVTSFVDDEEPVKEPVAAGVAQVTNSAPAEKEPITAPF